MGTLITKWFSTRYSKIVNSIAFLPGIITVFFLLLSVTMVWIDLSGPGKQIKAQLHWLSLKDATTARSIISSIVGGIISLSVFSFSLVMIILNQAASQLSNRILDKLIGNRFQQIVLGFYIGTIVFALFLLSTIRDIDTGISVPALSTYLLIALTIIDLFLFIYFLHYITQSVKYENIILRISRQTEKSIEHSCKLESETAPLAFSGITVEAHSNGVLQDFDQSGLMKLCAEEKIMVAFMFVRGTYLFKGTPFLMVSGADAVSDTLKDKLKLLVSIEPETNISTNYYYGFRQLMEVAVKALSPGINDPGTAKACLQVIGSLLAYRLRFFPQTHFYDHNNHLRIVTKEKTFEEMFADSVLPIWDYGKNDRLIQQEFQHLLTQLQQQEPNKSVQDLLVVVNKAIAEKAPI